MTAAGGIAQAQAMGGRSGGMRAEDGGASAWSQRARGAQHAAGSSSATAGSDTA